MAQYRLRGRKIRGYPARQVSAMVRWYLLLEVEKRCERLGITITQAVQEALALWMTQQRSPYPLAEFIDERTERFHPVKFPHEPDLPASWHVKLYGEPAPEPVTADEKPTPPEEIL